MQLMAEPSAGAMVLAQGPDGSIGLVPAQQAGSALMYPSAGLLGPDLMGAYSRGLPQDWLQARAMAAGKYPQRLSLLNLLNF